MAQKIKGLIDRGIQVALVIGAGNIFRGIQGGKLEIRRTPADQMGMLATIMNGIAFGEMLEKCGAPTCIMSSINCYPIAEPYHWQSALKNLSQGKVVIFVGGTASPYFTTDTAAALRASEIEADILLKATKVDGVYSKDPKKYPDAIRYETLTYTEVLAQKLEVMDATSIALCMSNQIPILVFDMQKDTLFSVLENTKLGTLVI